MILIGQLHKNEYFVSKFYADLPRCACALWVVCAWGRRNELGKNKGNDRFGSVCASLLSSFVFAVSGLFCILSSFLRFINFQNFVKWK